MSVALERKHAIHLRLIKSKGSVTYPSLARLRFCAAETRYAGDLSLAPIQLSRFFGERLPDVEGSEGWRAHAIYINCDRRGSVWCGL